MKKLGVGFAAGFLLLVGVMCGRTLWLGSRQVNVEPSARPTVDDAAVAARLAAAIRYRTISHQDPGDIDAEQFIALHAYLERIFPAVYHTLERTVVGEHSLLYEWAGGKADDEPILLMAHLDVVPVEAGSEKDWIQPPFSGAISDGFIWGRGTLDDKANALALLEAVELLLSEDFTPQRTVYLALGHDEEVLGPRGAKATAELLRERGIRLHYVLDEGGAITEGLVPGISQPVAMVGLAEKGYVSIELTVRGKGGHSSVPPAHTAVGVLSAAIARLEEHPMTARVGIGLGGTFSYLGPEMPFPLRFVMANLWLFEALVERQLATKPATNAAIRTTTAATMFSAGVKDNVLPATASAVVNFRILPGDSIATVKGHVERVVADPRITLRVLGLSSEPSPVSSTDSAAFASLTRTIRQVYPDVLVAPSLVLGLTDSRYFVGISDDVYRFTPMRLGADDLRRIHGTNERIGVEDYRAMVGFYARLIRNSAG